MDNTINNSQTEDSDFTPYTAELKEGQLLGANHNYRLEKNLGVGGMGEVWLAAKILEGEKVRKVVVKTLRPDRRGNEGAQAKALKQFQLIQTLNHTNICPIYDIEKDPSCGYLIIMGYAGGGSYADWFGKRPKPLPEVCRVLRPIADALDFAHSKGVIHRDVKPENMMFTADGTPWLIDFGIATRLSSESMATQGQFASSGSVAYMAPEQRTGEFQTAQTDEYSLAMVALEFLTGTTFLQAAQTLQLEIQRVLNKALALKPTNRYATCREFIDALAGTTLPAPPIRKDGGSPSAAGPAANPSHAKTNTGTTLPVSPIPTKVVTPPPAPPVQPVRKNTAPAKAKQKKIKWVWIPTLLVLLAVLYSIFSYSREQAEELAAPTDMETPLPTSSLKPGNEAGERKVLTADGIEYAFRWCPPGEFMMGCPTSDEKRNDDESQHRVKLTRGFWMLETEVTQEMWVSVMGTNPSRFMGTRNPVEQMSWEESLEFCKKLCQKLGQKIQLPTEAQWEYACRAGTTGDYAGDLDSMAWYEKNSDLTTKAVGQKKPNRWGLCDMHGNVWELCSDYYSENFYSKSPTSDPENTTVASDRVVRGGCLDSSDEDCRSACRNWYTPGNRGSNLGFRVLLVPSQK